MMVSNEEFMIAIKEFIDYDFEIMVWDNQDEFTEVIDENFLATTSAKDNNTKYDPFKTNLEKTLKQYQSLINDNKFRDNHERKLAKKMLREI